MFPNVLQQDEATNHYRLSKDPAYDRAVKEKAK